MSTNHYVGLDLTGFENNGKTLPVSRVTLTLDEENAFTAGDDSGLEITASCPFATQSMVDAILSTVKGYQYQMYTAEAVSIDPAAELGDGITADGVTGIISRISDDGSGYPDVSGPGKAELEDEFPVGDGPMTRQFNRKLGQIRSTITKTASQIRQEVLDEVNGLSGSIELNLDSIIQQIKGLDGRIGTVELTAEGLETRIQGLDGKYTELVQTVDGFSTRVSGLDGKYSELKQTVDGFTYLGPDGKVMINNGNINLTGTITFSDLSKDLQNQMGEGITKEIVHTLIKDDLLQSPRIEGADIYGGMYHDLNGLGNLQLTMTDDAKYPSLNFTKADDGQSVFSVWYQETIWPIDQQTIKAAIMSMSGRQILFTNSRNDTVLAIGNWQFSGSVSGLSGLSIAEENAEPAAQSDTATSDGPEFEGQSNGTPPKKVDFKQANGELKISLPDGTDWYLGPDGWHK